MLKLAIAVVLCLGLCHGKTIEINEDTEYVVGTTDFFDEKERVVDERVDRWMKGWQEEDEVEIPNMEDPIQKRNVFVTAAKYVCRQLAKWIPVVGNYCKEEEAKKGKEKEEEAKKAIASACEPWHKGDGWGEREIRLKDGTAPTPEICIAKCLKLKKESEPGINAVTVDAATKKICYCEIGQSKEYRPVDNVWLNCFLNDKL